MADFDIYLHLNTKNDFIWSEEQIFKARFDEVTPSKLDFKAKSGQSFKLGLGNTLKRWVFVPQDIGGGRMSALKIQSGKYRHPDDGEPQRGECGFRFGSRSDKSFEIENFQSVSDGGSSGTDNEFKYELFLENRTGNGKVTSIIIDPIITNDGTEGPGDLT